LPVMAPRASLKTVVRKILNYGHTIGHAVETRFLERNTSLLHGEAIAVGMVAEGYLSREKAGLAESELSQISAYLIDLFGQPALSEEDIEVISGLMLQDKKNVGSEIRMALLKAIGTATYDVPVEQHEIKSALEYYLTA